jgi:hypothetical protein
MKLIISIFIIIFLFFPDLTVGQKSYVQDKLTKSADAGTKSIKNANEVVLEYFKRAKEITFGQDLYYERKARYAIEEINMRIGEASSKIKKAIKKAEEIKCYDVIPIADSALTNYRAANRLFERSKEFLSIVLNTENEMEAMNNFTNAKSNFIEGIPYLESGINDLNGALERLKSCNSE